MRPRELPLFVAELETHAVETPDGVAVEMDGVALTYRMLERRANRLAHRLVRLGVGPEVRVAVVLAPSFDLVVALSSIWKARASYVPIEPDTPRERIEFIFGECEPRVIVTHASRVARLPETASTVICLDAEAAELDRELEISPWHDATPSDAAYVIYTSGSSGRPKGVEIEQRAVAALLGAQLEVLEVAPGDRILQFASIGFDASIAEIVMALGSGATLCIAPRDKRVGPALIDALRDLRISSAILPPSVLTALPFEPLPELRTLNVAGEVCPAELVDRWAPGRRFFNHYGPTEAGVWSTVDRCEAGRTPTIGVPVPGVEIDLVDDEIWIGGAGVGRGYVRRADLTARNFVTRPDGSRFYRSGDRGRRSADGRLEFVGRLDHQVKLRGHRIELGEIESVLVEDGAREAVAIVRDERLVAFVSCDDATLSSDELVRRAEKKLPDYMMPATIVRLDRLPRTSSGKIDRSALPLLVGRRSSGAPPETPDERWMAECFSEILGVEPVGLEDDFFALGGQSLAAARLLTRIREERGVTITFARFAESPSVSGMVRALSTGSRQGARAIARGPEPIASSGEERLWLTDELDPGRPIYNAPLLVELSGSLAGDLDSLWRALERIVERHEILRTTFETVSGAPVPRVAPPRALEASVLDWRDLPESELAERLRAYAGRAAREPFELSVGPLMRATFFRLRDDRTALLLVFHHIVFDGWSVGVLLGELAALAEGEALAPPSVQVRDFAAWERSRLSTSRSEALLAFWSEALAGLEPLRLPTDRELPAVRSRSGARVPIRIDPSAMPAIAELARLARATPYMVLLAALDVVLGRYSGQTDIAIGTPIANRPTRELEDALGFFVNTLVVRCDLSGAPSFRDLVDRVRDSALAAFAHSELPYGELVRRQRRTQTGPADLFRAMFVLENAPLPALERADWSIRFEMPHNGTAMYDLTLSLAERERGLVGHLEYDTELFDPETAARIARSICDAIESLPAHADRPITSFEPVSEADRHRLLVEWNGRDEPRPLAPVHTRFAETAARMPDAIAVIGPDGRSLGYGDLDRRSNQLAHRLLAAGARGRLVALSLEPSIERAIAVLGILKAGAACVPLDPSYPPERLASMVDQTRPVVHLATPLDAAGYSIDPPDAPVSLDDSIYVLFTSGSSGTPKGVVMTHRAIANLISSELRSDASARTTLQLAPLSFDVSFQEMFSAWCSGGSLVIADARARTEPEVLAGLVENHAVERLFLPVVLLRALADRYAEDPSPLASLREVCVSGERLRVTEAIARMFRALPRCALVNHYGPTETHVVTWHRLPDDRSTWPLHPPIGKPVDGCRVYVLDPDEKLAPIGVTGQLYVAGACLARGYHGDAALTAARFVPAPPGIPERVLYRTGDGCRWNNHGNLEFVDRLDRQVKIRGHRVELGEIEAALLSYPGVRAAVVVAHDGALSAYIVPADASLSASEVRSGLRRRLPEPMLPTEMVLLPALPLTPTGKLDRRALPRPTVPRARMPAATERQRTIAEIWTAVLKLAEVGVDDDFFAIGGHSLLAMQIALRVSRAFGVKIRTRDVFDLPTVALQAALVEELIRAGARP